MERRQRLGLELLAALDRRCQRRSRDEAGCRGKRVDEQPARRRAGQREQRANRAGERGNGVVGAEQPRRLAAGVGEHRLLERGERARLDDVGRDRAGQGGEDQRRQPPRQREDAARNGHRDKQEPVAAPATDPVAVAGDQHRDERGAGEQRGEDGADGGVGKAAAGERDADQHRAEPIGERPGGLGGEDPARVGAQARSS